MLVFRPQHFVYCRVAGRVCQLPTRWCTSRRSYAFRCPGYATASAGYQRQLPDSTGRYALFGRVPFRLGLEGAGCPQQYSTALRNPSGAGNSFRCTGRCSWCTACHFVGTDNDSAAGHAASRTDLFRADSACQQTARGHCAACPGAARSAFGKGLGMARQWRSDRKILLKR